MPGLPVVSMTRKEAGRIGALAAHKKWGSKHMTEAAREAQLARFKTPEEKTKYYFEMGRRRGAQRRKEREDRDNA